MKRILFLLITIFALISCEDSNVRYGRKLWKSYLNKHLKDPSSLVIYNESYVDGATVSWTIEYGAKNSFGGMKRETLKCKTWKSGLIDIEGDRVYTKEDLGL